MYLQHRFAPVPQSAPLNERQVSNLGGGYGYQVDKWDALDRFLFIGSQGGTYYVGEQKLTKECTDTINACIAEDVNRVVNRAVEISVAGRAVKQDYAIYALALALCADPKDLRVVAYPAIPKVCRTASTMFQLLSYLKGRRGWSRGLRGAIAHWYNALPAHEKLAYQMVKYGQRHGFTHRDALRLAHVNPTKSEDKFARNSLFRWAVGKGTNEGALPNIVIDFEGAKTHGKEGVVSRATLAARLPREALPTDWLNDPHVWEALLYGENGRGMPLTALIRNLGNLSKCGLLAPSSDAARYVVGELTNETRIRQARVHPIAVLVALKTYASGQGARGKGSWAPVGVVTDALNVTFNKALPNVEPLNKNVLVALDISGSMATARVLGFANLTAHEVAGAMALCHAQQGADFAMFDTKWQHIRIGRDETLERFLHRLPCNGGGTDIGQAFAAAQTLLTPYDAIVIYTDNETWAGRMHVDQRLDLYRQARNRNVKVVIAAATATRTSVGDLRDPNILQCVGFDASIPNVVNEFIGK